MTVIPDDELFKYSDRVKDKVVLITGDDNSMFCRLDSDLKRFEGAANGIGKETALRFGSYGCVRLAVFFLQDALTMVGIPVLRS